MNRERKNCSLAFLLQFGLKLSSNLSDDQLFKFPATCSLLHASVVCKVQTLAETPWLPLLAQKKRGESEISASFVKMGNGG